MQKLNSADDPRLPRDVQVLIEVEVIESLYAAMSTENKNPIDQSGVVEVTIIRPEPADSFIHFEPNFATLGINQGQSKKICEFQYHAKSCRRPATSNTNSRCRIPHLDRRHNKSFSPENLIEGPAINVGEIVGDLPSKVTSKQRIILPENNMKLHHGDHCDSFISDREIQTKIRGTMPSINPLVYHVRMEAKETQENNPLVELSAAEKILEVYEPDMSPWCNARQKLIEVMRKTLTEWGSDQKRIAETLYDDNSPLIRCEHCGVISFKKEQALLPIIKDDFSVKVDNVCSENLPSRDDERCLRTRNTETNFCDVKVLNTYNQVSRNQSNENTLRSKTSTCFTENESVTDKFKARKLNIEKEPKNSAEVKVHDSYYESGNKIFSHRSTNDENTNEQSVVDTMTMKHEKDSVSENMTKMTEVGKKEEFKTMLPLFPTNRCGRWSNVQKNEKSNDSCSKNTSSTRYFPKQIVARTVKQPARNMGPDNRNKNNFETLNKRTKNHSKNSTALSKDSKKTKSPICKNDTMDNDSGNDNETTNAKKCANLLSQVPLRKNKLARALEPPSNIPTKLEKTSSIKPLASKNVAHNYLVRKKPSAIFGKGKQCLVPSKNKENKLQSKADLWSWKNQTLLAGGIQKSSQDQHPDSSNLTKNIFRHCTASSDDKLSTDQEYGGQNNLNNSDDGRRSFRSMKLRKCDQTNLDFNCSAPMIGLPRKTFGNKDFAIDRDLAENTLPAQYNEESETTAFSSSSSENLIRDWAKSLVQVQRFDCESLPLKSNDDLSSDVTRSIKTEIDEAIQKCSTYRIVDSEEKLNSNETLTAETDNSLKSDQMKVFRDIDYVNKQYERFKNTNYPHFSANEVIKPSSNPAQSVFLRENDRRCRELKNSDSIASTFDGKNMGERCKTTDVSKELLLTDDTANITVEQSEIPKSQKNFTASEGIIFSKQKYVAIRTSVSKTINKSSTDPPKMTYKNSASEISSNSVYSDEYRQKLDVQQRSLPNRNNGSVLQFTKSETFERQITYDETSSKDISTGSKESLKTATQPAVYRKILESKDEMDWESFQQLVGTLHPSQRELWSDICKAVSNEAKRLAEETGASTEVCIEINPIPTSQAFSGGERRSGVKTSGNEISFEMDMILTDSESFFNQKSPHGPGTIHEPEKCH